MRILLLTALLLPLRMAGADVCAVYLNIIDSHGKPAGAPVDVIDQYGKVETHLDGHGNTPICNIGLGPHTIRVGSEKCSGYVTIHGVSSVYGFSRTFTAVSNGCISVDGMRLPPFCLATVWVISENGEKLGDAEVAGQGDKKIHADSYGRFFLGVPSGSVKNFTFSASGFADKAITASCTAQEDMEMLLQLARPK